jgi:outer membrane lipoprotein-sorting protein
MTSRLIHTLFTLLLCTGLAHSQSYTPIKDLAVTKKKIADAAKSTTAIQCAFTQEKHLSMLSERVISKGMFYSRADHRVRLEYRQPFKYLMLIIGDKMTIQDDTKTTQMDMHRSKLFTQVNSIITGTMQGGMLDNPDWAVSLSESSNQYKVELIPKIKNLKSFFKNIIIVMDKKDLTAARLEMYEPGGDKTIITFTNKILNGTLQDALFIPSR